MARKNATQATSTAVTAKKAAARRTTARKSTRSTAATAKKSTEIKPHRPTTVDRLKSPKVLVPVAVAVGLGVAAVRKVVSAASARGPRALPRMAKELSPRFSEAVRALADLGRELRSKIR